MSKYRHIAAWGRLLGSYNYFIELQQALAEEEGAPETACYKNREGVWVTFENLNENARLEMLPLLEE